MTETDRAEDRFDSHSVLGKVILVVESLARSSDHVSLPELVARTQLPKTTVHRVCGLLTEWGVVERVGTDYRLGIHLFELGQQVPRQRILRDAARPAMQQLLYETSSIVHLAIVDGLSALVIERLSLLKYPVRMAPIAGRMPLHCTAVGKTLLAWSPPELAVDVLREGLPRRTQRTITSALHLSRDLQATKARGVAVEVEETQVGYLGVGAPILSPDGNVVAAVSATLSVHKTNVDRVATQVKNAAASIAAALRAPEMSHEGRGIPGERRRHR